MPRAQPAVIWIGHDAYKSQVPYTKEQIRNKFKRFDKNGDGRLSWDEVKAAFAELGTLSATYRAWRGRRCADADNDGFISLETELDELVNYAMKLEYTNK